MFKNNKTKLGEETPLKITNQVSQILIMNKINGYLYKWHGNKKKSKKGKKKL